jgi:hypothetical protein
MDIFVVFSWKTVGHHRAWSVAECRHCQGLEPVRVEERIFTFSLYWIPVVRESKGLVGRCDFCSRAVEVTTTSKSIHLDDWSPPQGLALLMRKLGFTGKVTVRRAPVDERLRSLLDVTQQTTSLWNAQVLSGILIGLCVGVAMGIAVGKLLYAANVRLGTDQLGMVMISCFVCAWLGAMGGAIIQWMINRVTVAKKIVERAFQAYGIDLARLEELSLEYNHIVQRAVTAAREECHLRIK